MKWEAEQHGILKSWKLRSYERWALIDRFIEERAAFDLMGAFPIIHQIFCSQFASPAQMNNVADLRPVNNT
jgi:hypothetical protein